MSERFTLMSEIGRGGMGVVWKARDEKAGSVVAVKLLREVYAEDPDYVARFERELELAKRIHSHNVVRVLGYGVRDRTPYLALEYVDGPSLRQILVSQGPYSWPEARSLLAQIAQGLADAHAAGVIHRDLKPSNILIGSDGVARIADFGIARGIDLTRLTGTSTLVGTPAYLAPEGPEDARSDLYSLGVIGYELLAGVPPFEAGTYQAVILAHIRNQPDLEKLPPEARDVIGWLLAKDPADRPQRTAVLLPVLWGGAEVPASADATPTAQPSRLAIAPVAESVASDPAPPATPTRASSYRVMAGGPEGPGSLPVDVSSSRASNQPLSGPPAAWRSPVSSATPRARGHSWGAPAAVLGIVALIVCIIAGVVGSGVLAGSAAASQTANAPASLLTTPSANTLTLVSVSTPTSSDSKVEIILNYALTGDAGANVTCEGAYNLDPRFGDLPAGATPGSGQVTVGLVLLEHPSTLTTTTLFCLMYGSDGNPFYTVTLAETIDWSVSN